MLLTEVTFTPKVDGCKERDALADAVQGLFVLLLKNGQVWGGDEVWGWVDGVLRAVCWLPRPDSLKQRYHSKYVLKELARIEELCRECFQWQVIDDRAANVKGERWHESPALFLYTHMFDKTSPVCAGKREPVPLYLLPVSDQVRSDLFRWMCHYKDMDSVQIRCGPLEIPAYKEMAKPDSRLSEEGRKLAEAVEKATKIPIYYYLMRYWGRREGEENRLCPGCGGEWVSQRNDGDLGLGWFDFQCASCRLVSHMGTSFDDERHARIGEWRGRRRGDAKGGGLSTK